MATKATTDSVKNKLANPGAQSIQAAQDPATKINGLLTRMGPELQRALPKHMSADRLARIALTTIRQNPKLLQCETASLLGAVMQAAQLGLEPNLLGQCYLVPFKDNKTGKFNVQFIVGYKGYIELMRRSGDITSIVANPVYENDEFELEYGLNEKLYHKPCLDGERGALRLFYAYSRFKDGGHAFCCMSVDEINKVRDKYSKSKDRGPWVDEYESMCKKTVIRQLAKFMPLSVEIAENLVQDETYKSDILGDSRPIDYETGEIIEMVDITVTTEEIEEQPAG